MKRTIYDNYNLWEDYADDCAYILKKEGYEDEEITTEKI